mgnify:CR=1 FL=1
MTEENKNIEEKMELGHEPVPGYRKVFFITITIAVLYFAIILFNTV